MIKACRVQCRTVWDAPFSYTRPTNWIKRLNRDFRRVTRMRTAMPNEESVLGSVAMEHKAFDRLLPNITCDKALFSD